MMKSARKVPHLCSMVPSGAYDMADLGNAGGVPAVMNELKPFIHFDALTVTGKTVGENIARRQSHKRRSHPTT